MTIITGGADGNGNNIDTNTISAMASATVNIHTATEFKFTGATPHGNFIVDIKGTGLTYHSSTPTGGTITSLTQQDPGVSSHQTWSGFSISLATLWSAIKAGNVTTFDNLFFGGNDTFTSHATGAISSYHDNHYFGYGGNDTFNMQTTTGMDELSGGAGNDTFNFAGGFTSHEQIDGGTGTDTLNLSGNYAAGVTFGSSTLTNVETINLAAGFNYKLATNDATVASGQTLTVNASHLAAANSLNINGAAETNGKFAITGGAGNDTLTGGAGADSFDLSKGGNDTVKGLGGNDTFSLGAALTASDKIDGGTGTDTVTLNGNYASGLTFGTTTMVNVEQLSLGTGFNYKLATNDATVASGQTLTVDASHLAATNALIFNGSVETNGKFAIIGGAGNDTLTGGAGADSFDLSKGGNDTASGLGGNDTFSLGAALTASDKIDGGAGTDTVNLNGSYALSFGATTMVNVETLNLAAGHNYTLTTNDATVASGQTLTVDASTLAAANALIFNGSAETNGKFVIKGGAGDDTLTGGHGADTLSGGAGNDHLDGGAGIDTANYSAATGGVTVDLSNTGAQAVGGGQGTDTLVNIENLTGSAYGDTLHGNSGNNVIDGGAGTNTISGGDGNDHIIDSGTGSTIDGGNGDDSLTLDRTAITDYFSFYFVGNGSTHYYPWYPTPSDGTSISNIEHLDLTTNATMASVYFDNPVYDSVWGADTWTGNGADDGAAVYLNSDTAGITAHYASANNYVVQQTVGGHLVTTVSLTNIEYIDVVGGSGNDTLTGGGSAMFVFEGGPGNDTISSGGGTGYNYATYIDATGGVTVDLGITGPQAVGGGAGTDTLVAIENLHGSAHDDTLTGNGADNVLEGDAGNDTLIGGGGNDILVGGPGDDILNGGAGTDTASYSSSFTGVGVTVDLNITTAQDVGGGQGSDTLISIENLTGTAFNDTLIGDSGDNVLTGLQGDDTLTGGGGADQLNGGDGADTFVYGSASDSTGASHDTITGFDATADHLQLWFAVTGIDTALTMGGLSTASFDSDLGTAIGTHLAANHAIEFTPNSGSLAGHNFLIVDVNGTVGYQAGADLVIELTSPAHMGSLSTADFIMGGSSSA